MRFIAVLVSAALLVSATACVKNATGGTTLSSTLPKAELSISAACTGAAQAVTAANAAGFVSTADTTAILKVILQVELVNQQAEQATQAIITATATTTATQKANLLAILQPIQTSITNLVSSGLVGIKDPATKNTIATALTAINTAITVTLTIIQGVQTA